MPHFIRKVDKDTGRATMEPAPFPGARPEPISFKEPAGTLIDSGSVGKGVTCAICGKSFKTPGIFASHFNRVHQDKLEKGKKRKDTWRKYVKGDDDEPDSQ